MRCKILEVGPDDMLKKETLAGRKGRFTRNEYEPHKWLSGWFHVGGYIWLYFFQVRIEPEVIWE